MRLIISVIFGLLMLGFHCIVIAGDESINKEEQKVILESIVLPLKADDIANNVNVQCYTLIQRVGDKRFERVHVPPLSSLIITYPDGKLVDIKPVKLNGIVDLELKEGTYLFTLRVDYLKPTFSGGRRRTLKQQTTQEVNVYENNQQVEIGVIND